MCMCVLAAVMLVGINGFHFLLIVFMFILLRSVHVLWAAEGIFSQV